MEMSRFLSKTVKLKNREYSSNASRGDKKRWHQKNKNLMEGNNKKLFPFSDYFNISMLTFEQSRKKLQGKENCKKIVKR